MKQVIYGVLYLVVFVGVALGIYFLFFHTAPSCFDGAQNQGETGVDCGGPCAKVCVPATLPEIVVGNVRVFASSPGHYTFLAEVENHNTGFASPNFAYAFDLYDASGTLIGLVPGQSFIYASEVKYLLTPNVSVATTVHHAVLVMGSTTWTAGAAMGLVPQFGNSRGAPLPVTGTTISSSTIVVTGQVADSDSTAFTNVLVVAIFYDGDGNPVGASQTVLDAIAPNQTEDFSVTYPVAPSIVPSLTKVFAYALRS